MRNRKGFTLVELVIVIVVIGILAAIAVPRFTDLSEQAKQAQVDATVAAIRAVVALQYAKNAADPAYTGSSLFPDNITADMFADGQSPRNALTGRSGVTTASYPLTGTSTIDAGGFWYVGPSGGNPDSFGMVGAFTKDGPPWYGEA